MLNKSQNQEETKSKVLRDLSVGVKTVDQKKRLRFEQSDRHKRTGAESRRQERGRRKQERKEEKKGRGLW